MDPQDCFEMESQLAFAAFHEGELKEGIRALLIDKDNEPNWKYKDVKNFPSDKLAKMFAIQQKSLGWDLYTE